MMKKGVQVYRDLGRYPHNTVLPLYRHREQISPMASSVSPPASPATVDNDDDDAHSEMTEDESSSSSDSDSGSSDCEDATSSSTSSYPVSSLTSSSFTCHHTTTPLWFLHGPSYDKEPEFPPYSGPGQEPAKERERRKKQHAQRLKEHRNAIKEQINYLYSCGKVEEALTRCEVLMNSENGDLKLQIMDTMVRCLLKVAGRAPDAIAYIEAMLQRRNVDVDAWSLLAFTYEKMDARKYCLRACVRALHSSPSNPHTWVAMVCPFVGAPQPSATSDIYFHTHLSFFSFPYTLTYTESVLQQLCCSDEHIS